SRGGSADMPQISSYPETAEAAAYADERLAKQRASGRRNTTGEGNDWPRDWKLDKAKAAGKIWYADSRPIRLKSDNIITASVKFSVKQPTAEELRSTHQKYVQTVPNSYATAVRRWRCIRKPEHGRVGISRGRLVTGFESAVFQVPT